MIVKSVSGKTIVKTEHKTMRRTLEWCAEKGVDLSGADLRRLRLSRTMLDGLRAPGSCLWGADLTASDISLADLSNADLRCSMLKDTCLAESDLSYANLQGAYFSGTILEETNLEGVIVSCPSFWDSDLQSAGSLNGLVYNHRGEEKLTFSKPPLVIEGFHKRLVVMQNHCLWGADLFEVGTLPPKAQQALFGAKTILDRTLRGNLHPAKAPIPKILNKDTLC